LLYRLGGARAIAAQVAGKLGYRGVFVYVLTMDQPPVAVETDLPLAFGFLGWDELDAFSAHCPGFGIQKARALLQEGHRCYVARLGEEIASSGWVQSGPTTVRSMGVEFELAAGQVYVHNAFTGVQHRGHRALPALGTRLASILFEEGCRAEIALVKADNLSARRNAERIGHRRTDTLSELSLGPLRVPLRETKVTSARFLRKDEAPELSAGVLA
jgi:hypothetical protein